MFLEIFRRFSTTFQGFLKILQNLSEVFVCEDFPKISEVNQRLLKKIRRCFDNAPTNLSEVNGTEMFSENDPHM